MNYCYIIIIITVCIILLLTCLFSSNKEYICKKDLFPQTKHIINNFSDIFIKNKKSQFNQDVMMYFRYFVNKIDGVFVEIGAFDGLSISNTYFYEKNFNWHGFLIEGGINNCKKLFANAYKRKNSKIICSPICKSEYTNYIENGVAGKLYNSQSRTRRIKCNTLSNITQFYNVKHIDLFSLDVEGSELEVLETFDFSVSVSYWLIEWPHLSKTTKSAIIDLLKNNGYVLSSEYISPIDVLFSHV